MTSASHYTLRINCLDQPGIVAAVTTCIAKNGGDISECQQFDDPQTKRLVMRVLFSVADIHAVERDLDAASKTFNLTYDLIAQTQKPRVLIMVSKMDHCLADLLYHWRKSDLKIDLVAVVSNHETCRAQVEAHGIPYVVLPVTKATKPEQEAKLATYIDEQNIDLVVLARYMQILSDDFSSRYFGKIINIHHSFLPSFKGARAYHQAYRRGVKIIGATAHYVTPDLDEGPIIEQEVARVKHSDDAEELVRIGRGLESAVLARAVRWHAEHRVFLNQDKTVVFN